MHGGLMALKPTSGGVSKANWQDANVTYYDGRNLQWEMLTVYSKYRVIVWKNCQRRKDTE